MIARYANEFMNNTHTNLHFNWNASSSFSRTASIMFALLLAFPLHDYNIIIIFFLFGKS